MVMRRHSKKGKHLSGRHDKRPTTSGSPVERKVSMSLTTFKNFNADRMDIDEFVALLAFGKSLRAEYDALQIEEPEYIDTQLKSLRREISVRSADKVAARKRELLARIDSLKTPAQKKSELEAELKKLKELEPA